MSNKLKKLVPNPTVNFAYLCDQKACGKRCSYPECLHTFNMDHAINKDRYKNYDLSKINNDFKIVTSSNSPELYLFEREEDDARKQYLQGTT